MGPRYRHRPPAPLALPPSSLSAPLFPRSSCPCHPRPSSGRCRCLLPVVVIVCSTSSASSGPHRHVVLTVVVVCSLSLSSFVPPPPPHLVLIAVWSSPLSSLLLFHRGPRPRPSYRCLVLVPVVILGPPSPTSLVRH